MKIRLSTRPNSGDERRILEPLRGATTEPRSRAHQICLERGGQLGHEIGDWLHVEYESMRLPVRKLAEQVPPKPNNGTNLSLVQPAGFFGAEALPYLR